MSQLRTGKGEDAPDRGTSMCGGPRCEKAWALVRQEVLGRPGGEQHASTRL